MPNTKAAAKAWRQMKKRALHNRQVKIGVTMAIKQARRTLSAKEDTATTKVLAAIKTLDKAAQKGIIKRNTASRKKSRLMRALNKAKTG